MKRSAKLIALLLALLLSFSSVLVSCTTDERPGSETTPQTDAPSESTGEISEAVTDYAIVLNGESFQYYDPSIDELSTKPGRYQILYGTSSLEKDLKSIDFEVK